MFATGIVEEPAEGARVISITEEWVDDFPSDVTDALASAVARCANPRLVRDDGTFDVTIDVRRNVDRATITVGVTKAMRRLDTDGRC